MTAQDYVDGLAAEDALEDLGVVGGEFHVRDRSRRVTMAVLAEAVARMPWADLRPVLVGERRARVLSHMTRIVGYFSMEHNWNGSKIAEQADPRKGHYWAGGTTVTLSDDLPDYMIEVLAGGGRMECKVNA